jgi:hypothetical protein
MKDEVWKDVPGYEEYYQASNLGSIRSIPRIVPYGKGKTCKIQGRILKPRADNKGRLTVTLCKEKQVKVFFVHHLVLLSFVGPRPEGMICRHFPDRNPSNCNLNNIQWGTYQENERDKVFHGTDRRIGPKGVHYNIGESNGMQSKMTVKSVRELRALYTSGHYTQKELAERFNISDTLVCHIINRKKWRTVN